MDRILTLPRVFHHAPLAAFLRQLREARRLRADARQLDSLPRERLEDMGIAPRTEANHRHSGEAGNPAEMQLW